MTTKQRTYSEQEKAQIALTAIKNEQTTQISSAHQIHATQIGLWKKHAIDNLAELFKDNQKKRKTKRITISRKNRKFV